MRNGVLNNKRLRYILPLIGAALTFRFVGGIVKGRKIAKKKNTRLFKLLKKR